MCWVQEMVEEVQKQATAEGAFGRATSRYLDQARPDAPLPLGASWCPVKVKSVCPLGMLHGHITLFGRV